MSDAHVLLIVTVAFTVLLFLGEWVVEGVDKLAAWLDRRGL